jgi:hypothetical protein
LMFDILSYNIEYMYFAIQAVICIATLVRY